MKKKPKEFSEALFEVRNNPDEELDVLGISIAGAEKLLENESAESGLLFQYYRFKSALENFFRELDKLGS